VAVIDVHTHMIGAAFLAKAIEEGRPHYVRARTKAGLDVITNDGAPYMTLTPPMFDYGLRIRDMDAAGVDIAIVSVSGPTYWGAPETSAAAIATQNDDMAAGQAAYPGRIRWLASLPWHYPPVAVKELARACDRGAVGVMVLANILGRHLTDVEFAPVWQEIDRRALPVLVHPTAPPGVKELGMEVYNLTAALGFMVDTSTAVARMIFDGFLDRYPNLKLIAAHAGATLPYLAGRLDICFDTMPACREKISRHPSEYLKRIWYDAVTYQAESLALCIQVGGADKVMYGSDYPHNIGDMTGILARVDALPAGQREAVRGANAARLFGL
jgi:aminocarboxymuconate-semialdehyde decarboxylase